MSESQFFLALSSLPPLSPVLFLRQSELRSEQEEDHGEAALCVLWIRATKLSIEKGERRLRQH